MRNKDRNLHYCNHCKITTRHQETLETATCLRCGVEKKHIRFLPIRREPWTISSASQ